MTELVAIDPGDAKAAGNVCYAARFYDGVLSLCFTLDYATACACSKPHVVVIEKPQMDGRSRKTSPRILINLAWNGALVAGVLRPDKLVPLTPSEWKGGVNKHPHHMKIWRVLTPDERLVLCAAIGYVRKRAKSITPDGVYALLLGATKNYNRTGKVTKHAFYDLLDAVGLGLRYLGRMGGGTYDEDDN